ncbi:MAG: xanthine phosphoribosyltransferase [Ezakiella sp.]|nr:xanthine phosphoribosyltransferase [Ezakiella sp.]MDD7762063.1 xanthine phosphoribosyltransferase [Bacillota bacterium]MDY3946985.1 xanthine phosphoribosyltransferase [Ezakiella sp.]
MDLLKEKIIKEGIVESGGVLRVDNFLNHRLDIEFINEVGLYFKSIFQDRNINKILTIESSGIAIATITAQYLHVPVVFAKKNIHVNLPNDVYVEEVKSSTADENNIIVVSKEMLSPEDNILIVDDFLAKGNALKALITMVEHAGGKIEGVGIVIEKLFQGGGDEIRNMGIDLVSLAKIESMDDGKIIFRD